MYILCDTCSVLMLIRVAPEMFLDERFECKTIRDVWKEIFQTQKFKTKYPWRADYKRNIKPMAESQVEKGEFAFYLKTISNLIETGTINSQTGKFFNLSRVDQKIAACALTHQYEITTGDQDLIAFVKQEFFKQNVLPLHLVNKWLAQGLIQWDNNLQNILEDWKKCDEAAQLGSEKSTYRKLTGKKYPGP